MDDGSGVTLTADRRRIESALFQQGRDESWPAATFWSPRVDVEQKGDAIVIRADLPGVHKEDIRVEATEEGVLQITVPLDESARPRRIQIESS
jgi:HSP20 family molecular chaperone IbpA